MSLRGLKGATVSSALPRTRVNALSAWVGGHGKKTPRPPYGSSQEDIDDTKRTDGAYWKQPGVWLLISHPGGGLDNHLFRWCILTERAGSAGGDFGNLVDRRHPLDDASKYGVTPSLRAFVAVV